MFFLEIVLPLFLTILFSFFFCHFFSRWGKIWHFTDKPYSEPHKRHTKSLPSLGGVAMGLSWLIIGSCLLVLFKVFHLPFQHLPFFFHNSISCNLHWFWIIFGGFCLWTTGFIDDYKSISAILKLLIQIIVGGCLVLGGIIFNFTEISFINILLTIFWLVLLCNALNFLDNMDGLAGGIAFIVLLSFIFLALFSQNGDLIILGNFFLAALCSFLYHNFPKATLFMGDAGSLLLGYIITFFSILLQMNFAQKGHPITGWFLISIPLNILIIDLFCTIFIRLIEKRPIYKGDNSHISHRFLDIGFNRIQAVSIILGLNFILFLNTIFASFFPASGYILFYIFSISCIILVCLYQLLWRFQKQK